MSRILTMGWNGRKAVFYKGVRLETAEPGWAMAAAGPDGGSWTRTGSPRTVRRAPGD